MYLYVLRSQLSPTWSSEVRADPFVEDLSERQPNMIPQYDGAGDDGPSELPKVNRIASAKSKEVGSSRKSFNSTPFKLASLATKMDEVNVGDSSGLDRQAAYAPQPESPTEAFPSFVDVTPPPITVASIIARGTIYQANRTSLGGMARETPPPASLDDLKKFSESFKLTTPMPKDIASIIGKDATKPSAKFERSEAQSVGDKEDNKRFAGNNQLNTQPCKPATREFLEQSDHRSFRKYMDEETAMNIMIDTLRGFLPARSPSDCAAGNKKSAR